MSVMTVHALAQNASDVIDGYSIKPDTSSFWNTTVGGTPVKFDVSSTGAAECSLPIECPKGINGIEPNISLEYNSQSGDGIAGFGCSIQGLSVITRGSKTVFHDGAAQGRNFSQSDALYLDGRRLIQKNGNGIVNGATFVLESDPYSIVTVHGNGSEQWFSEKLSNGNTVWYGRDIDSRQVVYKSQNVSVVNAWFISRFEDKNENVLAFRYTCDQGTVYPELISYGRNGKKDNEYFSSVTFNYDIREYQKPYIINGVKCNNKRRLKSIETKFRDKLYRKYTLNYSTDKYTCKDLLTTVETSCGVESDKRTVELAWDVVNNGVVNADVINVPETDYYQTEKLDRLFTSVDINGDGVSDMLEFSPVKVTTAYGSNYESVKLYNYCIPYLSSMNDNGEVVYTRQNYITMGGDINFGGFVDGMGAPSFIDMNGDGIQDVIIPNIQIIKGSGINRIYFYTLYGKKGNSVNGDMDLIGIALVNTSSFPLYTTADLDADGRGEIVVLEKTPDKSGNYVLTVLPYAPRGSISDYSTANIKLKSAPQNLFSGDFNNDGLIDLLVIEKNCSQLIINKGGTKPYNTDNPTVVTDLDVKTADLLEQGDFNGDGVLDLALFRGSELTIAIGNGDGTFKMCPSQTFNDLDNYGFKNTEARMLVYDFNHDGKTDIVIAKANLSKKKKYLDTRTFWLSSNGNSFELFATGISKRRDDAKVQRYILGDFNGDGHTDMINYGNLCLNVANVNDDPKFYMYSKVASPSEDKVVHICNNFDTDVNILYDICTSANVYTPGTESLFPIADCTIPLSVVCNIKKANGILEIEETNLKYNGLKAHLQGKGLLGFSKVTSTDCVNGSVTETEILDYDRNSFLPSHVKTVASIGSGKATTETINKIEEVMGRAFFSYPRTVTETDYEGNVTKTDYLYNSNIGQLIEKRVTYDDGSYVKTNIGDFCYVSETWYPRSSTTVAKSSDDDSGYRDVTTMKYDNWGNVISTTMHDGTDKAVTTDLVYDAFGNVVSKSSSASGVKTIITNVEYDNEGRLAIHTYTEPASADVTYTYDCYGNMLTETDSTDSSFPLTTIHIRDCWGNEKMTVSPEGNISGIISKWKDYNNKSYFTVAYGNGEPWTKTIFDQRGRVLQKETIGVGNVAVISKNEYDKQGNISSVITQNGKLVLTKNMTYDDRNRLLSETYSTGRNVIYSYGKRKTTISDNGRIYSKEYDAHGNIKKITDPVSSVSYEYCSNGKIRKVVCDGNSIELKYDDVGNRIQFKDPDAGIVTYSYDGLSRLIEQRDGQDNIRSKKYDKFGRIEKESGALDEIDYYYNAKGLMTSVYYGNNSTYRIYDKYNRIRMEQRNPEFGETQIYGYKYDDNGHVAEETLPGDIKVGYSYDSYGNCISVNVGGTNVWSFLSDDGLTMKCSLFGGKMECATTKNKNGFMSSNIVSFAEKTIDGINFSYNGKTGNLEKKSRYGDAFVSCFGYDNMDRLVSNVQKTQVLIPDTAIIAQPYDGNSFVGGIGDKYPGAYPIGDCYKYAENGNLLSATSVGKYTYCENQPHAVKTVENINGAISVKPQQVIYNTLNLPDGIIEGEGQNQIDLEYYYGTDNSRWHAEYIKDGDAYRVVDYGDGYEKVTENDTIREFWYLDCGILLYRENKGTLRFLYMLTDNVGSIIGIFDENGKKVFHADYDPWGVMTVKRNDIGFIRGYTGHEMLSEFKLVNMNGRVYDPYICRFLSPDNYVQLPENSQSFNRYSYCLNNPLKYNDPSGEYALVDDAIAAVFGGIINLGINIMQGNIHGDLWSCIGKGTVAFVSGAIAGVGGLYPEFGGWAWGGAVVGATNSWLSGEKGWGIAKGATIGLLSSGLTGCVGDCLTPGLGSINYGSLEIANPILNGLATGSFVGSASGFISNFALALILGASLEDACNESLMGAVYGAASGAVNGVGGAILSARENKVSPWTGEKTNNHHSFPKFLGGEANQELTPMSVSRHVRFHKDFNEYLLNQTDEYGNNMRPVRGNSGKIIRKNFDYVFRKNATRQFYDSHPLKYWDARMDFYRINDMILKWRPW